MHRLKMRHSVQSRAADVIGGLYKLFKIRKSLALIEAQEIPETLAANTTYQRLLMESDVFEVRLNNRIREFVRQRDLLKIEAINRNLMIKKLIDKVDEDLGAVSFILGSIKETEIKTDFLIKEQEEDIERMKEQYRNFQILEIMLNRFDVQKSSGQQFL